MYFQTGQVIFVPEWPNGEFVSILASFWTKSLECVKMLAFKGFHYSEEFQKILSTSQKISNSLLVVRTIEPSRPDAHLTTVPYVRTTCHTVWTPFRPSIIRPNDVHFHPDPPLCQEVSIQLTSVRTTQQHVRMPISTRPASDSFQD
jgi:hypothetical protein